MRSRPLRLNQWLRALAREARFIVHCVQSGQLLICLRSRALARRLVSQKALTYIVNMPPLRNYKDLLAYLDDHSVQYQEGGFCIYIPPQEKAQQLFEVMLSAYPPDVGLKILKDLRSPREAVYCSSVVNPNSPKLSDWISHTPLDYLRVANYLYSEGLGPRVYDLTEIQTPHNRLTAYVVQHVAGTAPSQHECETFLSRLRNLYKDHLIPLQPDWELQDDFRCPQCRGNLIHDEVTGQLLYVDFQAFLIKDPRQHVLQRAAAHCPDCRPGSLPWQQDKATRWISFREALQKHGASIEGAVVYEVGCNAGMIMYSALADGAAWAVGWDKPEIATATQRLLLSLGATRFGVIGEEISADTDFHGALPEHLPADRDAILFFRATRDYIGFPDGIKDLPFRYLVYEHSDGGNLPDLLNHLKAMEQRWGLQVIHTGAHGDREEGTESLIAILRRKQ